MNFKNGKFKILVLSDIHEDGNGNKKTWDTINFIEKSIAVTSPDLVVFDGDNVTSNKKDVQIDCIRKIVEPVKKAGIPLCFVFGNHDDEYCGVSKEAQLAIYKEYDKCLNIKGEDLTGYCNFNLPLKDSSNEKNIFNLWFIDSNTYDKKIGGYGFVEKDQIEWYEKTANKLKEENGGVPVPSILFQHIAVPEEYDLMVSSPKRKTGYVRGNADKTDRYWHLDNKNRTIEGKLLEGPCPPNTNHGQFESWVKTGDIKLAVFGHDHINTFSGELKGIRLMQAGGAGFHTYYRGASQSGSLLTINENDLSITRKHINFTDILGRPKSFMFGLWG